MQSASGSLRGKISRLERAKWYVLYSIYVDLIKNKARPRKAACDLLLTIPVGYRLFRRTCGRRVIFLSLAPSCHLLDGLRLPVSLRYSKCPRTSIILVSTRPWTRATLVDTRRARHRSKTRRTAISLSPAAPFCRFISPTPGSRSRRLKPLLVHVDRAPSTTSSTCSDQFPDHLALQLYTLVAGVRSFTVDSTRRLQEKNRVGSVVGPTRYRFD